MAITAIIVTHNSAGIIQPALSCVSTHADITECIVVDNASTDSTWDIIRSQFPRVTIICNSKNVGFGVACNQALEKVNTEFALFLNPDASIDKDGIDSLLAAFSSHPEAAIAAPLLPDNSVDKSTAPVRSPVIHDTSLPVITPLADKVFSASFISGALALWRMEHMRQVGFFDPAFFLFYEDDDISIRTRKAGYKMLLVGGIRANHVPGTSCGVTEEINNLKLRSLAWAYLYIHRKYRGKYVAALMALRMALYAIPGLVMCHAQSAFAERKKRTAQKKYDSSLAKAMHAHKQKWRTAATQDETVKEREWASIAGQHMADWAVVVKSLKPDIRILERKRGYTCRLQSAIDFLRNPTYFVPPGS